MVAFSEFYIYLQVTINGILLGFMYGIAAMGLGLIFGSMQIMFITQGAVMILASYCIYWMVSLTSIEAVFGFLLIIPLFLGFGWIVYVGLFQRIAKAGKNPSLLLAFGLMVLLENAMALCWSSDTRSVNTSYSSAAIDLGMIYISISRLIVAVVAILATVILYLFLKKTMLGKAIRGVAEDMRTSALLGISPTQVCAITFAIGIALAGIAGVATSIIYPFDPFFGFSFSIKALIAVAFGGLGSITGALLGGIILGVLESVSSYMISAGWADAVAYAAFLLVLIIRPEGLMGIRTVEKV